MKLKAMVLLMALFSCGMSFAEQDIRVVIGDRTYSCSEGDSNTSCPSTAKFLVMKYNTCIRSLAGSTCFKSTFSNLESSVRTCPEVAELCYETCTRSLASSTCFKTCY